MCPLWDSDRHRDAYVALLNHPLECPACRTSPALCPDGKALEDAWRKARREACRS